MSLDGWRLRFFKEDFLFFLCVCGGHVFRCFSHSQHGVSRASWINCLGTQRKGLSMRQKLVSFISYKVIIHVMQSLRSVWSKEHSSLKQKLFQNSASFLCICQNCEWNSEFPAVLCNFVLVPFLIFCLHQMQLLYHPFLQNSWRSYPSTPIQANFYSNSPFIFFALHYLNWCNCVFLFWQHRALLAVESRERNWELKARYSFDDLGRRKSWNTSENSDILLIFVMSPSFQH